MDSGYRPIDCEFHDRLEAYATTRTPVRLTLAAAPQAEAAPETFAEGRIADIYTTAAKEEYLRLEQGEPIRLDRIRAVAPTP